MAQGDGACRPEVALVRLAGASPFQDRGASGKGRVGDTVFTGSKGKYVRTYIHTHTHTHTHIRTYIHTYCTCGDRRMCMDSVHIHTVFMYTIHTAHTCTVVYHTYMRMYVLYTACT